MGNMSYCRFENTLNDLRDFYDHLDDEELSKEEHKAMDELISLCIIMTREEINLRKALEIAKEKSHDGNIYVVWREDDRNNPDQFVVSEFDAYLEEACLMAFEYGRFEGGQEV